MGTRASEAWRPCWVQEEAQATVTAATLLPRKGSQYSAGCWEELTGWGWGGGAGGGAAEGTTLSSGPAVILEKPIRIPRFLSVKASHVLKGFLNKVRLWRPSGHGCSPSSATGIEALPPGLLVQCWTWV